MRGRNIIIVAAIAALCAGCATAPPQSPFAAPQRAFPPNATILLMPADVEVREVGLTGTALRADWTALGAENLIAALSRELTASGETVIAAPPAPDTEAAAQARLLQRAVTETMAEHVVAFERSRFARLPHHAAQPERYSLGEAMRVLAPETESESESEADYALFLTSRSDIATGALLTTEALVGAVTVYVPDRGRFRGAFLILVEIESGDVLWAASTPFGDPREANEAEATAAALWRNSPLAAP